MSHRSRDFESGSMMDSRWQGIKPTLSDDQWSLISDLFPDRPVGPRGGRPRVSNRACFEGILWVLRSGARWKDLPSEYPSYVTCWRRLVRWTDEGIWDIALTRLLKALESDKRIDWEESFADATFASAKKGAIASARPDGARVPSSWCLPTVTVFHLPSTLSLPTVPKSI